MACCCIRDKVSSFIRRNKVPSTLLSPFSNLAIVEASLAATKVFRLRVFDGLRVDKLTLLSQFLGSHWIGITEIRTSCLTRLIPTEAMKSVAEGINSPQPKQQPCDVKSVHIISSACEAALRSRQGKIGFVSQNHRRRFSPILLGRLSRARAWSPPLCSMNSARQCWRGCNFSDGVTESRSFCSRFGPDEDQDLFRMCRFLRRTPAPPPLASMNSIPPASNVR